MSNEVGQLENQSLMPAESLAQALGHLARYPAVGGWKKLAQHINPNYADDAVEAGKWLDRALDPDRREVFSELHMRRALRLGIRVGCHVLWQWYTDWVGYQFSDPLESKSRRVALLEADAWHSQRKAEIAQALEQLDAEEVAGQLRRVGDRAGD